MRDYTDTPTIDAIEELDESFSNSHLENLKTLHENQTTLAERVFSERIDYEVRGAYRAGYNYLYLGLPRWSDPSEGISFEYIVFPSYMQWKPKNIVDDAERYTWNEYDLDISPAEYRDMKQNNPDN